MKPSTRNSQIAAAKAQATCVPMPSARARVYMRTHHSRIDTVRKPPAISHQPPSFSGGSDSPYCGAGGSSDSQNSWRTNCTMSQLTWASMLKPMMLKASTPKMSDAMPSGPR